jgi:diguanylate cyclase (GGDEF)-like protein
MSAAWLRRSAPRAAWVAFAAAVIACAVAHPFGPLRSAHVVSGAALVAALLAGWACMVVSGRPGVGGPLPRAGWSLAGTGAFLLALSQGSYLAAVLGLARSAALDACLNFGYMAAYPALLAGAALLALVFGRRAGLRPTADAACALGGLGLASWYWLLRPLARGLDHHPAAALVATLGPLLDLALTFAAFLLLYLPAIPHTVRPLAAGLPMVALGGTLFAFATLRGLPGGTGWSEIAWALGLALVALAPFEIDPPQAEGETSTAASSPWTWRATLGVIGVGAITLAAVSAVLLTEWRTHHTLARDVIIACFGLVAATLAHQVFSVVAHGHASSQLHGSNQRLEETVAERTRQLHVLHDIVRAATSSLDVNEVLSQILKCTTNALPADATAVWLLDDGENGVKNLHLHAHSGFDQPEHRALLAAIPPRWGRGLEKMLVERRSVPVACEAKNEANTMAEVWCAPLEWRGRTMGVLGAARWQGGLGRTERGLLEAVALEVAVALQNARLYHLAVEAADHDGVTGLLNHRAIVQQSTARIQEAGSTGEPLAVILIDLDNFKRINDIHGHLVGDQVLKCVGALLRECCREGDVAGRYGGDEFILICPRTDAVVARELAEGLKARLKEAEVARPGGGTLPISASFGVALYPQMAGSHHELLALADVNLYESKAQGDGKIVGFEEDEEEREPLCAGSFSTLDALVTAVDKRDRYTRKHSEEVTEYSLMIAQELGLSEETMRTLRIAGLLHDLGKIAIPDAILRKPGGLTDEEFEIMKQHPVLGWLIVSAIPSLSETLPAIRHHHERWDGRGYPDQLVGEQIPLLGRLMAVPDAFSAMTTDRPYRKGMDVSEAVSRLRQGSGSQFDPAIVAAFIRALGPQATESDPAAQQAQAPPTPPWRQPAGVA